MPLISEIKHPLKRDGNSQNQRILAALDPQTAAVDGRTMMDMLHYLAQFSREVQYYDLKGNMSDWSAFFRHSAPFRLAYIAQFNPDTWWEDYLNHKKNLLSSQSNGGLELVIQHIFNAFVQHQQWHWDLRKDTSVVSQTIHSLTATNLRYLLIEFMAIQNVLVSKYGLQITNDPTYFTNKEGFNRYGITDYGETQSDKMWDIGLKEIEVRDVALDSKRGTRETILPTLLPRLDRIADLIYKAQLSILASFPTNNTETLIADDEKHEPHLGLLFAFLRLFQEVQGDINKLSERHLRFFYENVLLFQRQSAVPDKAHLVFELARQMGALHLLKQDTLYKAGKDNNKTEIQFGLDNELVVNRVEVAEVRTLFYSETELELLAKRPFIKSIEKGVADPAWASFGHVNTEAGRIGWVFASPVLALREGNRMVSLTLTFRDNLSIFSTLSDLQQDLKVEYSTKDSWEKAVLTDQLHNHLSTNITVTNVTNNQLTLSFRLDEKAKPLEALSNATINPYGSNLPMLRFQMTNSSVGVKGYYEFINNPIQKVEIHVDVIGLKSNIFLQNTEGGIDPTRPFSPFGATASSPLWLGSEEFDNKTLTDLKVHIPFEPKLQADLDSKNYYLYSTQPNLSTATIKAEIGVDTIMTNQSLFTNSFWDVINTDRKLPLFNNTNRSSLLKISIVQNDFFRFNEYQNVLTIQSKSAVDYPLKVDNAFYKKRTTEYKDKPAVASGTNIFVSHTVLLPEEPPYSPIANSLTIDYAAKATGADIQYFRLMPFVDGFEAIKSLDTPLYAKPIQDVMVTPTAPSPLAEGNLYIGLKNAVAQNKVSLLFQFSEYSGNPDLPLDDITWYCLRDDNSWKPLQRGIDYQDSTIPAEYDSATGKLPKSFVQSGIICFTLPQEAALKHTTFPEGMIWLRAAVNQNALAFDHLIGVHAQAALSQFRPTALSDLTRLNERLTAKKVAKPVIEDAGISKIEQLYPSFDGLAEENFETFRRRVSERLRHKGRAVTIYDYEMLVLQKFPIIYKAKCLNHSRMIRVGQEYKSLELSAGNVVFVVVPDVRQLPTAAQEEPKANQETLANITAFLQKRCSPFAFVEVVNPDYQKVGTKFNVKFRIGKDPQFYKTELEKEIKIFLSPWMLTSEIGNLPKEIQFGGAIEKSSVLKFVEDRPYVDYVEDFTLEENGIIKERIEASTARSVLAAGGTDIGFIPKLKIIF